MNSKGLSEAKKRLRGNSCVNTGRGSGGGFTACSASVTAQVKKTHDAMFSSVAKRFGKSAPALRDEIDRQMRDWLGDADVYVRVPAGVVARILDDGRIKTQFESKSSGGMFNPSFRSGVEHSLLGIDKKTKNADRPVYGYLAHGPERVNKVAGYGGVAIKLKPEAKARVKFTVGDSFKTYRHGLMGEAEARQKGNPVAQSISTRTPSYTLNRKQVEESVFSGGFSAFTEKKTTGPDYIEAMVLGGVKVSDIASVTYTTDVIYSGSFLAEMRKSVKRLQSMGIEVHGPSALFDTFDESTHAYNRGSAGGATVDSSRRQGSSDGGAGRDSGSGAADLDGSVTASIVARERILGACESLVRADEDDRRVSAHRGLIAEAKKRIKGNLCHDKTFVACNSGVGGEGWQQTFGEFTETLVIKYKVRERFDVIGRAAPQLVKDMTPEHVVAEIGRMVMKDDLKGGIAKNRPRLRSGLERVGFATSEPDRVFGGRTYPLAGDGKKIKQDWQDRWLSIRRAAQRGETIPESVLGELTKKNQVWLKAGAIEEATTTDRYQMAALKDRLIKKALTHLKVTGNGEIVSKKTGKTLPGANLSGYRVHKLTVDGKKVQARAHRIVALSRHGHLPKGTYIDHKNRNRSDNRPGNLKVATPADNARNRGAVTTAKTVDDFSEAKKKLRGNSCVNAGQGSGGGFTSCSGGRIEVALTSTKDRMTIDKTLAYIDARSRGKMDLKSLRAQLKEAAPKGLFGKTSVDPKVLKIQDLDLVKRRVKKMGGKLSSDAIVVDSNGYVIDGRHRAVRALLAGKKIEAYAPITRKKPLDEALIAEAKKKLRGNSCVNTGQGSGGGFTSCSDGGVLDAPAWDMSMEDVYKQAGFLKEHKAIKARNLTKDPEERRALNFYTRGDIPEGLSAPPPAPSWIMIGRLTRDGASKTGMSKADAEVYGAAMDKTIGAIKAMPQIDGAVYRGFDANNLKLSVGGEFVSDSIFSASVHPGVASRFAGHRRRPEWELKKGLPQADISVMRIKGKSRLLGSASAVDSEFEAVFLPGQRFRVVGVHKRVKAYTDGLDSYGKRNSHMVTVYDVEAIGTEPSGKFKIKESVA